MRQFREIIETVLELGADKQDRTGTGTRSYFGIQKEFNLRRGFPILTGKFVPFKTMTNELLWFLSGSTNNEELRWLNGTTNPTIWEEWADLDTGDLGPIYGKQWRSWSNLDDVEGHGIADYPIDQIATLLNQLKNNPDDRGMLVTAWNVADLSKMALRPCHHTFQLWTRPIPKDELTGVPGEPMRYLSCKIDQRSCDTFLGVPFNIASYALLTHIFAHCSNMIAEKLIWSGGDVHIYNNHREAIEEYLIQPVHKLPNLIIRPECPRNIDKLLPIYFELENYRHGPVIDAPIAI